MKRTERKNAITGKNAAELQTELEALLKEQFGDFFLEPGSVLGAEIGCFHVIVLGCGVQAPTWRATKVVFSGSLAEASWNASRASSSGTPLIS